MQSVFCHDGCPELPVMGDVVRSLGRDSIQPSHNQDHKTKRLALQNKELFECIGWTTNNFACLKIHNAENTQGYLA